MATGNKVAEFVNETQEQSLAKVVERFSKEYGTEVVENRAVPEFRDGCKPVHRAALWAMYKLGLSYKSNQTKAARVVGDVIGKYHPHGDCLEADTRFFCLDGNHRTIAELYEQGVENLDVLAYDQEQDRLVPATARAFRIGQRTRTVHCLKLSDGSVIRCTSNHPFLVDGEWVKAENLKVDNELTSTVIENAGEVNLVNSAPLSGLSVASNTVEQLEDEEPMYDFTVDGYENALIFTGSSGGEGTQRLVVTHNSSTYDAIVTIANTLPNLVEGYGNWGSHVSAPAAYRYTECRLSEFSTRFMLDPKYIAVTPMVKNFSGEEEWPLFLPAKLPVQLMVGSATIPAYGISAGTPPFCIEGVWKVTVAALMGKTITPKLAAKYMKVRFPYGGECVTPESDYINFFQTGKGTLTFVPDVHVDWQKKEINIESCAPGFMSFNSTTNKIETIGNLDGVRRVEDESGINAGEYGIRYVVETKRGLSEQQFDALVDKVQKILVGKQAYHIGYTRRKKDDTSFGRASITSFFDMWIKYRIALEKAVINNLIKEEKEKAAKNELMVLAVELKDLIFDSLNAKDPHAALAKSLSIGTKYKFIKGYYSTPQDIAKALLALQVIKLAKLNTAPYKQELKNNVNTLKELATDLGNPSQRILREMKPEVEKYLKTTKDNILLIGKGD